MSRHLLVVIAVTMVGYVVVSTRPPEGVNMVALAALILVGAAALFTLVPLTMAQLASRAGPSAPVVLALNGSVIAFGQGTGAALGGLSSEAFGLSGLGLAGLAVIGTAMLLVRIAMRRMPIG